MTNDNQLVEAGSHPRDFDTAMEYDLSRVASDPSYKGQATSISRDPSGVGYDADGTRAGDELYFPNDEAENNSQGADEIFKFD